MVCLPSPSARFILGYTTLVNIVFFWFGMTNVVVRHFCTFGFPWALTEWLTVNYIYIYRLIIWVLLILLGLEFCCGLQFSFGRRALSAVLGCVGSCKVCSLWAPKLRLLADFAGEFEGFEVNRPSRYVSVPPESSKSKSQICRSTILPMVYDDNVIWQRSTPHVKPFLDDFTMQCIYIYIPIIYAYTWIYRWRSVYDNVCIYWYIDTQHIYIYRPFPCQIPWTPHWGPVRSRSTPLASGPPWWRMASAQRATRPRTTWRWSSPRLTARWRSRRTSLKLGLEVRWMILDDGC